VNTTSSTRLPHLLGRALSWYGPRVAVVDGVRERTYAQLNDRTRRLAGAILGLTGQSPSRVALLLTNRLEFVEADVALIWAAKTKVAINPWLTDDERRYILDDSGADLLITEKTFLDSALQLLDQVESLRQLVVVDGGADKRWLDYEDLLASSPRGQVEFGNETTPSVIIYTSGTTGRPKGAVWTSRGRLAATRNMMIDEICARSHDGMIHVGPLSHGSGSKIPLFLLRGGRHVLLPRFDTQGVVDAVANQGGTATFMVPTMITRILDDLGPAAKTALAGLRHISYGAAPMPLETIERGLAILGPVFVQVYGSSEAPHPVTVLGREDHLSQDPEVLSSAGRAVLGVDLSFRDPDTGSEVDRGDAGELWIRGNNVMSGYWRNPQASDAALVDGWYRTGDVAQQSEDGLVSIVDRLRDLIITGGMNVYPAEVERVLRLHPAVEDVCVVGLSDRDLGEAVTAFVVTGAGHRVTTNQLVEHSKEHLASYKKPRNVHFVESLPRGSTGKVLKASLREMGPQSTLNSTADNTQKY
jgi:acyl-CoA synthetase (AMP-forming)/AMP-acid ligase II